MWLGEQITQRGIGNGISLIIFAGIVSAIPSAIGGTIDLVNNGQMHFLTVIGILLVIFQRLELLFMLSWEREEFLFHTQEK